jgi:hypothetical protein
MKPTVGDDPPDEASPRISSSVCPAPKCASKSRNVANDGLKIVDPARRNCAPLKAVIEIGVDWTVEALRSAVTTISFPFMTGGVSAA